jgi:hypothetical protein
MKAQKQITQENMFKTDNDDDDEERKDLDKSADSINDQDGLVDTFATSKKEEEEPADP